MKVSFDLSTLEGTLEAAKAGAIRYRAFTGKPLGITAEVGEFLVSLRRCRPMVRCPPQPISPCSG